VAVRFQVPAANSIQIKLRLLPCARNDRWKRKRRATSHDSCAYPARLRASCELFLRYAHLGLPLKTTFAPVWGCI